MKTLITALIVLLSATAAMADGFDLYGESFRGDNYEATERFGLNWGDFGITGSYTNKAEQFSVEVRRHITFTNIEIGGMFAATYGTGEGFNEHRVIEAADNVWLEAEPYVKIGSDVFVMWMYDSTNQHTVRFGFNLF